VRTFPLTSGAQRSVMSIPLWELLRMMLPVMVGEEAFLRKKPPPQASVGVFGQPFWMVKPWTTDLAVSPLWK